MEKERLFTIGQFADLHQINKKTLMWYDEIGLFKPAKIEDNGYRYYTYYQSGKLETMRELEMSIAEIKSFLEDRCAETYIQLLGRKADELTMKIRRMKRIQRNLRNQERVFSDLLKKDLSSIEIVKKKEEWLYVISADKGSTLEQDIEQVIASVKKHKFSTLHDTAYGSLISVSHLQEAEYDWYDGLFMKASAGAVKEELHKKPEGTYLQAYHVGAWEGLPGKYKEILKYAEDNLLSLYGYSYEMGVNDMLTEKMDDYITQIEIPVRCE